MNKLIIRQSYQICSKIFCSNGSTIAHTLYRNGSEGALPANTSTTHINNNKNKNSNNKENNNSPRSRPPSVGTISPSLIITPGDDSNSNFKMSRRASSADSQSSTDSRGQRR